MQPLCLPRVGGFLLLAAFLARSYCSDQEASSQEKETLHGGYTDLEIVYPVQTDEQGIFLSYDLSQRNMRKRDLSPLAHLPVYYQLHYRGLDLTFNVTVNTKLLAPGFVRERRSGGFASAEIQSSTQTSCHLIGEVQSHRLRAGLAALSSCNGLMGLFHLSEEDYFIEPVEVLEPGADRAQPHRIYRHQGAHGQARTVPNQITVMEGCGVKELPWTWKKTERWREHWEQKQNRRRRIVQRSISQEKWVETLVVADPKMVEYHGSSHVDSYILTVMNMVAGLFHDPSIGNPVNIVVVRLVLLDRDEEDLKISHHADNTLKSFCKWQKSINPKGDAHPTHHDVAVLITRKDICAAMNRPCETLGLSHVSGMCQPHRSCNINEDTGLPLAFTVAHELGHSFGIQHDGSGNDCEPVGKKPFIMSPQLLYDTSPLTWSHCSRDYITRFLDRGWGLCLDDPPAKQSVNFPSVPPGVLYDVGHQCRLQYGAYSTFCEDIDNVCNTLWCSVGTTCHSKLNAAVDGTKCGDGKWCFDGECVPVSFQPGPIHGGWGAWSSWSRCSRSCGAGVQNSERRCTNPTPKYGGKYCLGERQRYRLCNTERCASEQPSFRQLQCSRFDALPYKGKLRTWIPLPSTINPCELHCRPEQEYFSEKLLDAVVDGTPCYEGSPSRDICINGICKNVGCDYEIDSNAVEDRCGVCHGDDSTCQTVKKTFEESEGLGYVDIGLIPAGAREIRIEEMAEAGNFLALRSEDPDKYFLNGGWTIQWNGNYPVAGTTFTYERTGNWENLTAPGPTIEPVWIQLLFQETNPGVRYQYTVQRQSDHENEIDSSEFSWRFGSWTSCTATCGMGVQRQIVYCVEKLAGIVEERYCESLIRPDDIQRTCNEEPCPARWWVGEWQPCSASCGDMGVIKRTVLCIQSVRLDEQRALQPADCQHIPRPDSSMSCNHQVPCPVEWTTGIWSECSVTCGTGIQRRLVYCSNDTASACSATQKPSSEIPCSVQDCPVTLETPNPNWSGSGSSSQEIFNEIHYIPQSQPMKPQINTPEEENLITAEDFITGNKKSRSRNIFVDDFYYDYNFINFHEDLSDNPLSEKDAPSTAGSQETSSQAMVTNDNCQSPSVSTGGESGGWNSTAVSHAQDNELGQVSEKVRTTQANSSESYKRGIEEQAGNDSAEDSLSASNGTSPYPVLHSSGDPSVETFQEDQGRTAVPMENVVITTYSPGYHHIFSPTALQADTPTVDTIRESEVVRSTISVSAEEERVPDPHTIHPQPSSPSPKTLLLPMIHRGFVLESTDSLSAEGTQKSHEMRPQDRYSQNPDPQNPATLVLTTPLPLVTSVSPLSSVTSSHAPLDFTQHGVQVPVPQSSWHWNSKEGLQLSVASPAATVTLQPKLDSTDITILPQTEQRPSNLPSVWKTAVTSRDHHGSADANSLGRIPKTKKPEMTVPNQGDFSVTSIPGHNTLREENPHSVLAVTAGPTYSALREQDDPHSVLAETSIPSLSAEQENPHSVLAVTKPQWEVGSWSECSTTCGLGALWRTVQCSTGKDTECDMTEKPIPAQRCYLRPCALWHVGNWSKCSKNCGGGLKIRDVQCVDTRDQRLLRPFHCQAVLFKPPVQTSCHPKPCMDWYISSWRECSEACGGGLQERLVTCPEFGRCDETLKPSSMRPCNLHPCTTWVLGSWGECTASCGGGIQRRLVKCVNTQTGATEEDNSMCEHEVWPENTQKCNPQDCNSTESSFNCKRDRLTFSFCQTLKLLGRCHLPTVKIQCCHTCQAYSPNARERGNDHASRR
ncbi:A disintegrin and metalloproteinase with thrombospondin motifs 7 isoform X2 [Microcaecilia unicolor]|uniref:A disintegrin and metalloproteinase with thrombospondin motifs 7 isoform X2 n=1 Tax=Microcaecilia unicolor TaxID=1415580 RepID=A0A6P7WX12_9AMPH|nr:A disintegrin and metalloproteinase with thrombospondin motifs 7 isoform X2 [Microcaecilia unicolor]